MKQMKVSSLIRSALLGASLLGGIWFLYNVVCIYSRPYYAERDEIRARLESIPNVEVIAVDGTDGEFGIFEVRGAAIRLVDRPGSFIQLAAPGGSVLHKSNRVLLSRIGRWTLGSCGTEYGATKWFTLKKNIYGFSHVDVGPEGPIANQIPFPVRGVEDVIAQRAF